MSLSSIIKIFLPKDRVFYSLFEEVGQNLDLMSQEFSAAIKETDSIKRQEKLKVLDNFEHKNDDLTHRIFIELGKNFITPFDREDIHYLATALDDVADYIWSSAKRILNYNIEDIDETAVKFVNIITKAVTALHGALGQLRNLKDIRLLTEACVTINSLENEADDLLDSAMVNLFNSNIDAVSLMKKKDLYEELEIVTDKCEEATNVIESIIIKYA